MVLGSRIAFLAPIHTSRYVQRTYLGAVQTNEFSDTAGHRKRWHLDISVGLQARAQDQVVADVWPVRL